MGDTEMPVRADGQNWMNADHGAIADLHEALDLLADESRSTVQEPVRLHLLNSEPEIWEIVVPWFTSGDSGGDQEGLHYFYTSTATAQKLLAKCFVTQRMYVRRDRPERVEGEWIIAKAGQGARTIFSCELLIRANGLLKPGVHTDLTGTAQWWNTFCHRDFLRYGPAFFICCDPHRDGYVYRVYPESEEIKGPFRK